RLEVPAHVAGHCVERDDRVRWLVVARTVAAVVVRAGRRDGHVDEPCLLVDRQRKRPDIVAGAVAPAVVAPGLVSGLTGLRDRVVLPDLLAGDRVEAARVAVLPARIGELRTDVRLAGAE